MRDFRREDGWVNNYMVDNSKIVCSYILQPSSEYRSSCIRTDDVQKIRCSWPRPRTKTNDTRHTQSQAGLENGDSLPLVACFRQSHTVVFPNRGNYHEGGGVSSSFGTMDDDDSIRDSWDSRRFRARLHSHTF
jgi:hypothetical protein